jgi:hypothetical protein
MYTVTQLVKHCTTSRNVAGSILDGFFVIFQLHNPSGCSMAVGLTQPLTEMSIRNISSGLRWKVCRADNLTTFICRLFWNLGASASWKPQGLSRPAMELVYLYIRHRDERKKKKKLSRTDWPAGAILNVWYMNPDRPTVNCGGISINSSLC